MDPLAGRIHTDRTGEPEARRWLSPAWLPEGRAALLTGPGGSGKSLLALQLAAALASGNPDPFGTDGDGQAPKIGADSDTSEDRHGQVLYATWEDEPGEVLRRLAGIPSLDRPALGLAVERYARSMDPAPRLIVVDPTAAAYGGNENDRAACEGLALPPGAPGGGHRRGCAPDCPSAEDGGRRLFGLDGLEGRRPGAVDPQSPTRHRLHRLPGQEGRQHRPGPCRRPDARQGQLRGGRAARLARPGAQAAED